jgi:hypothetical protein
MIKILIIEIFPENSSERSRRKALWETLVKEFSSSLEFQFAEPFSAADGFVEHELIDIHGTRIYTHEYNLVFVHQSDADYLLDGLIEVGTPFICYGAGGGSLGLDLIKQCQITFLPLDILESNIEIFFRHLSEKAQVTSQGLNIIVGYDPDLARKLEMLHHLATQNLAATVYGVKCPDEFIDLRNEVWTLPVVPADGTNPDNSISQLKSPLTVEVLVGHLSKMENCFSDEYIDVHRHLRDVILR